MKPINLIFASSVLLGLIAVLLVCTCFRNKRICCRLLATYFLVFTFFSIYSILIETGWIINWPYLIGLNLPLYFFPSALGYLYVRSITTSQPFNLRTDWWQFAPALVCLIDLLPFYLVGRDEKQAQISQLLNGETHSLYTTGSLTSFEFYLPALLILGLWHLLAIFSLLTRFKSALDRNQQLMSRQAISKPKSSTLGNAIPVNYCLETTSQKELFKWLGIFTALYTIFWLTNSIDFISSAEYRENSFAPFRNIGTAVTLILSVVLFFLNTTPYVQNSRNNK
ncbi:hypothetical protein [Flavihumibacter sp. UBA7668]|uniref:hypothetical protein n=1 Tax=Flavihumibacter sp. UBA7668 TaxID=1946542 RepID=UPI0025BB75A1|nr:hypothetical protein [Flavihumibacter sp. UBA7668]